MFLDVVLGVHIAAAAIWIGGSLFSLLLLRPLLRSKATTLSPALAPAIAGRFKDVVEICLWAVIITGAILTFDGLTAATLPISYIGVLLLKLALVGWMALIALNLWERGVSRARKKAPPGTTGSMPRPPKLATRIMGAAGSPPTQAAFGVIVLFLAEVLRTLSSRI